MSDNRFDEWESNLVAFSSYLVSVPRKEQFVKRWMWIAYVSWTSQQAIMKR